MRAIKEQDLTQSWESITKLIPLTLIRTRKQYSKAVEFLDSLIDKIGSNENHPLADLMDTVGTLIHEYEAVHHPLIDAKGIDALKYLMEEHELRQSDFPEIGTQGVVSEILSGKRALNLRQIKLLADRFHISPEAFI